MIKKKLYGNTLKEQFLASAKDRLYPFLLADGATRGVMLHGTRMVNEMRANHQLGILETLVLGRAYLGAGLMSADLKGADRISITVDCSGPIKGLVVEANAFGEIRGFLKQIPIPIEKPVESFDLSSFFGEGLLSVTKHLQHAKQPFTGQIALEHGNLAQDLAHYYLISEQVPSAFNLSIKFDKRGEVTGAGGLFLQAMPKADDDLTAELEKCVIDLPSLGEVFSADEDPQALIRQVFGKFDPRGGAERRIEFMCHCSKYKLQNLLTILPIDDLRDIRDNGPFPLELRCHHCNSEYYFSKTEIEEIYGQRYPNN